MLLHPYIETPQEIYQHREWVQREAARYYARCRRDFAEVNQVLDIWLRGPRCDYCQASDPFDRDAMPTISARSWEEDVAMELGEGELRRMVEALAADDDPVWYCVGCHSSLRPWDGDDVFVATKHLEEAHFLLTETGPRQIPPRAMRRLVRQAYEHSCFWCRTANRPLTVDHIIPRSRGGDAAFRNLQPLCEACQQKKGVMAGEEITVHDNVYFRSIPGDSYEGLFW